MGLEKIIAFLVIFLGRGTHLAYKKAHGFFSPIYI
jgi:hypothetical protein